MTDLDWNGSLEIEQPNFDTEFLVLAGPAGQAGAPGAFQNTYKAAWSSGASYLAGDLVKNAGAVWLAKTDNSNVTPAEGATWTKVVDSGTNGRSITSIARTSGTGAAGSTDVYTITYSDSTTSTFSVVNGTNGQGVPVGGTTGQVLRKKTATNYDTEWATATAGGGRLARTVRAGGQGTIYSVTTNGAFVEMDSTNLAIAITFPSSGKAKVTVEGGLIGGDNGDTLVVFGLMESGVLAAGTARAVKSTATTPFHDAYGAYSAEVSGTAGTTKTYRLAWRAMGAGSVNIQYGGGSGESTGYWYGPIVMEAWTV